MSRRLSRSALALAVMFTSQPIDGRTVLLIEQLEKKTVSGGGTAIGGYLTAQTIDYPSPGKDQRLDDLALRPTPGFGLYVVGNLVDQQLIVLEEKLRTHLSRDLLFDC
ncbi:MAG: hypothetical protein GF403_01480 [Candidatus Coatesbacteria bacterium]|nr:hypothetical protein [Candidatus Coatesbacteria bacterium]